MRSELLTRTLSGIVAAAVALACLWAGGLPFWLLVSGLALAMLGEWCGLLAITGWRRWVALAALTGLLVLVQAGDTGRPLVLGSAAGEHAVTVTSVTFVGPLLLLAILAAVAGLLTLRPAVTAGLLYVGLPALSLLFLRTGGGGLFGAAAGFTTTLLTLLIVWGTDIGAFIAGRAIGGPKLAPAISPGKTWAGLAGGMVAAAAVNLLVTLWIARHVGVEAATISLPRVIAVGAVLAVLAQAGDLFESRLKRRAGVKDSGRLLPGHGGALDRLDGLVPVAVAMALLMFFGR